MLALVVILLLLLGWALIAGRLARYSPSTSPLPPLSSATTASPNDYDRS